MARVIRRQHGQQKSRIVSTSIDGRSHNTLAWSGHKPVYQFDRDEFERLSAAGKLHEQSRGDENIYFEFTADNGETCEGYCKCL